MTSPEVLLKKQQSPGADPPHVIEPIVGIVSNPLYSCVAVLSENPCRRQALSQVYEGQGLTVRTFDSIEALLEAPDLEGIGCIVADAVPAQVAATLARTFQERLGSPSLLLLCDQPETIATATAMRSGLFGVLDVRGADGDLFSETAAAMNDAGRRRRVREAAAAASERLARLSRRERQILDLIVGANSNKEISRALHVSIRTVENHRARILSKLEAESSMHLLRIMLAAKGIPLD